MKIFVHHDGEKLGPYTVEETQDLLEKGEILSGDLAWHEGLDNWIALSALPAMGGSGAPPQAPVVHQGTPYAPRPQTNGLAIASLILGISAIVVALGCCLGIVLAIPGAICGHMALGQIRQNPEMQSGRELAIAGLWTSYITIALTILLPLGMLIFFGSIAGLESLSPGILQ